MSSLSSLILGLVGVIFLLVTILRKKTTRKLPPGPRGLPIIGTLHMIGNRPHYSLKLLADKYGPIMTMKFGMVPTIVVSSPETAELILKTHDTVFASRPETQISHYFNYGTKGMLFTEYGPYWRSIRRLAMTKLFSQAKIDSLAEMRREEIMSVIGTIKDSASVGEVVNVSEKAGDIVEWTTCKMVIGRRTDEKLGLMQIVDELFSLAGAFNIGEHFPILRPLDLQGFTKRIKETSKIFDAILEEILEDHMRGEGNHYGDFVDELISVMKNNPMDSKDEPIDRDNIKAILVDLIGGGIDTTTTIIDWTMSELMRNPRVLKKLQTELKSVVGMERTVEVGDLPNLPYLDMVAKETLRLHPAGTVFAPHASMEDITMNGYFIPKNSHILVNVWAVHRDPKTWSENADDFIPERFESVKLEVQGLDLRYIPFGSGRRTCPGMKIGYLTVRMAVAQFVHCFDWELPKGELPENMDMTERCGGLTVPRARHLLAYPTYRLHC